jgi:hypothetical protein
MSELDGQIRLWRTSMQHFLRQPPANKYKNKTPLGIQIPKWWLLAYFDIVMMMILFCRCSDFLMTRPSDIDMDKRKHAKLGKSTGTMKNLRITVIHKET